MNRIAMSAASSGLLRALIARAGGPRDRILLTHMLSSDWQSLTMTGERHAIEFRMTGPDAKEHVRRLCSGLKQAEFRIAGQIVADIALAGKPEWSPDGSVTVKIEALTVEE